MLGFEVNINGNKMIVASENGVTSICLNYGFNSEMDGINICGSSESYSFDWGGKTVQNSDKVIVRLIETDQVSIPEKIKKKETRKILEEYYRLKKELQEKGMI